MCRFGNTIIHTEQCRNPKYYPSHTSKNKISCHIHPRRSTFPSHVPLVISCETIFYPKHGECGRKRRAKGNRMDKLMAVNVSICWTSSEALLCVCEKQREGEKVRMGVSFFSLNICFHLGLLASLDMKCLLTPFHYFRQLGWNTSVLEKVFIDFSFTASVPKNEGIFNITPSYPSYYVHVYDSISKVIEMKDK